MSSQRRSPPPNSKDLLLVVFDSVDGQTRKIAEYVCELARQHRGCVTTLRHAKAQPNLITLANEKKELNEASAVIVLGPIRNRALPASLFRFARDHAVELAERPSALFYVSLGAAARQRIVRAGVTKIAQDFMARTSWRPEIRASIAGAIAFPRYSRVTRLGMWLAARVFGLPTSSSSAQEIQELTDWSTVERETMELLHLLDRPTPATAVTGTQSACVPPQTMRRGAVSSS